MPDFFRVRGQIRDVSGDAKPGASVVFTLRDVVFGDNYVIPPYREEVVANENGFFEADLVEGHYFVSVSFDGNPVETFPLSIPEGRGGFLEIIASGPAVIIEDGSITIEGQGPANAVFTAPKATGAAPLITLLNVFLDGVKIPVFGGDGNGSVSGIPLKGTAQTIEAVWTVQASEGDPATYTLVDSFPPYSLPAQPAAPQAVAVSTTEIRVTLAPDAFDGGTPFLNRALVYSVDGGDETTISGLGAEAVQTISGLTEGVVVSVAAVFETEAGTVQSSLVEAQTWRLPLAPAAGVLEAGFEEVFYTWPAPPSVFGRPLIQQVYVLYTTADEQIATGVRQENEFVVAIPAPVGVDVYAVSMVESDAGPGPFSAPSNTVAATSATLAPPPTANNNLQDLTGLNALVVGVAMEPVDLSVDFQSEVALSFALAPSSALLVPGLTVSSAGLLSGTPTESTPSTLNIVIRATDTAGQTVDSGFSLEASSVPVSIIDWTPPSVESLSMSMVVGANATLGNAGFTGDMLAFADKTRTNLILGNFAPDPAEIGALLDKNYYYLRSSSSFSGSNNYRIKGPSQEVTDLALEGYTGMHEFLWQGSGTIRRNDALFASSSTARVVTFVDPVSGATEKFYAADCNYIGDVRLNVHGMDESQPLDADPDAMPYDVGHIRNMRLIHKSRISTQVGAGLDGTDLLSAPLMDPLWVREVGQLGVYRVMNWENPNTYVRDAGTYFGPTDDQVPLKASTWNPLNGRGGDRDGLLEGTQIPLVGRMPYAAIIAAYKEVHAYWQANIQPLGANRQRPVWYINLPMDISDDAMAGFAQLLTTLPAGAQIRVEIGNELWNAKNGFSTFGYCEFMGASITGNNTQQSQGFYAHRVSQLFSILFTEQPSLIGTVIPIAGASGADVGHINSVFNQSLQAQLTPASTPLQTMLTTYGGEIVIGAYAGLDDTSATLPILQELVLDNTAFVTLDERAEAMYRFFMFGTVESRRYDVARGGSVVTGMIYDANTAINLAPLIWDGGALEAEFKTAQKIHVRKNRFLELFQLVGADIQFRPDPGSAWTTVASFDAAPPDTLEQMFDKMRITASGGIIWGTLYPMTTGTVYAKTTQALKHTSVRDATGIPLSVYEFGNFMDNAPPNDRGLYRFFLFDSPYATKVVAEMARRFNAAGCKAANFYTSHQRNYDQEWGACLYTGHWANAVDKWREVPRFDILVKMNEAHEVEQPASGEFSIVSLNDLPRDGALFDATSGPASVPLSGTTNAPNGTVIEARFVSLDDGGAQTTETQDFAVASGGAFSGAALVGMVDGTWLAPEVHVKGSAEPWVRLDQKIGTSHSIAFFGQSEMQRFALSTYNGSGQGPTIIDEDNLQVFWSENENTGNNWGTAGALRGGPVTNSTPQSIHARGLSNALSAAYPGRKFCIALHARGGTSRGQSASPDATERNFPGELAIRNLAFPIPEMRPGITYESWFYNDMFNVATGEELVDERIIPYAIGQNPEGTAGGFPVSIYPDLYDSAKSVHGIALHRYDAQGDTAVKMGQARQALADYFESNPNRPAWLRRGTDALTYQNKNTDWAHPNTDAAGDDYVTGMVRYFRELVAGALRVGGVTTWEQPEFTNAALAGDSTYVEVWTTAGDVTTYRNILSDALPAGYPEVWGFRHNDVRTTADIVAGRVRVYPVGGGTFADGDKITFASDGAGAADPIDGTSTGIEDNLTAEIWKDHPVVDLGANNPPLLDAVPVRAATPAGVLAVIPDAVLEPDDNTNPNLATASAGASHDRFTAFSANPGNTDTGWKGSGWTFNGDGTAIVGTGAGTGYVKPAAYLGDMMLEMSFVVRTPNNATGTLSVSPRATKFGGDITYFGAQELAIANNVRHTLVFERAHPRVVDIFSVLITPTVVSGTVVLSDITLKEVEGVVAAPTLATTAIGGVGTFDATVTPSDDTVSITYDVVDAGGVSVGSGTISTANLTAGQPASIVQITGLEAEEHTVTFTQGAVTAFASATVEAESPWSGPTPTPTSVTATATGTTVSWSAELTEAGGEAIYAAIRLASDNKLLASQIEPGTGNAVAVAHDTSPTADGNNGGEFTGLAAGETYAVDVFYRRQPGNQSPVTSSNTVTLDAAPTGPVAEPNWSAYVQPGDVAPIAVIDPQYMRANTDGTGAITAVGQTVRWVEDRSGLGLHRIYPNGSTYRQDANGNDYLEMDGVSQYWYIPGTYAPASADGYTAIGAASLPDPTKAIIMHADEGSVRLAQLLIMVREDGLGTPEERGARTIAFQNNSTYAVAHSGQFPTANTPHTLSARLDTAGNALQAWLDGESQGPATWGLSAQETRNSVLYGFVRKGAYVEGRDYGGTSFNRPLPDVDFDEINTFFAGRSGSAFEGSGAAPVDPPVDPTPDPDPVDPPAPSSFVGQGRFTTSQTSGMDYRTSGAASGFDSAGEVVENGTIAGEKPTDLWIALNEHDEKPYSADNSKRFDYIAHVVKASGDSWQPAQKMITAMPMPPNNGFDHAQPSIIWDAPRNRYLHIGTNHNNTFIEMATAPSLSGPWTRTNIKSQMDAAIRDDDPDANVFQYTYARPFVLADGNLYLKFRQGAVGGNRRIARSLDGGVTWQDAKRVLAGARPYSWGVPHPDNSVLHIFTNKSADAEMLGPGSNSGIYHLVLNPSNYSTLYEMDGTAAGWGRNGDDLGAGIVSRLYPYDACWRVRGMVEDDGSTFGRPACVFLRYVNKLSNGSYNHLTQATDIEVWWARWNPSNVQWQLSLVADLNLNSNVRNAIADIDPFTPFNVVYNENGTLRKAVYNGSTWTKSVITTGLDDNARPAFDHIRKAGPRVWAKKSSGWQLFSF